VTIEPISSMAIIEKTGTLFSYPYSTEAGDLNTCFLARRAWLRDSDAKAAAFVKALAMAKDAVIADKHMESTLATKLTGVSGPVLEMGLGNVRYDLRNGLAQTQVLAELAAALKFVSKDVSAELPKFVEDKYLKAAGVQTSEKSPG